MPSKPGIKSKPRSARKAKAELRVVATRTAFEAERDRQLKVWRKAQGQPSKVARWLAAVIRRLLGRA